MEQDHLFAKISLEITEALENAPDQGNEGQKLMKSFERLKDKGRRRAFLALVKAIADAKPSPSLKD